MILCGLRFNWGHFLISPKWMGLECNFYLKNWVT